MDDLNNPRVRVLKAEHEDIEDRHRRTVSLAEGPATERGIHDVKADELESERMVDIEDELKRLDQS